MGLFDFLFKQDTSFEIVKVKDTHWSDDWDKAEYRIKKTTYPNGDEKFVIERKGVSDKEYKRAITSNKLFDYDTYEKAVAAIEYDRNFYKEAWNEYYCSVIEYLPWNKNGK